VRLYGQIYSFHSSRILLELWCFERGVDAEFHLLGRKGRRAQSKGFHRDLERQRYHRTDVVCNNPVHRLLHGFLGSYVTAELHPRPIH
jgi:hypothetical protein